MTAKGRAMPKRNAQLVRLAKESINGLVLALSGVRAPSSGFSVRKVRGSGKRFRVYQATRTAQSALPAKEQEDKPKRSRIAAKVLLDPTNYQAATTAPLRRVVSSDALRV